MWWAVHLYLFKIFWGKFLPRIGKIAKLDDIWLSYNKYEKGDVFLRHSVEGTRVCPPSAT